MILQQEIDVLICYNIGNGNFDYVVFVFGGGGDNGNGKYYFLRCLFYLKILYMIFSFD